MVQLTSELSVSVTEEMRLRGASPIAFCAGETRHTALNTVVTPWFSASSLSSWRVWWGVGA